MQEQDVILLLDLTGLGDQHAMEKHLRREGLKAIEGEPFAYMGSTTTHKINTLLYVHDGVKKAIHMGGFLTCNMMVSIGDEPMESYRFDLQRDAFVLLDTLGYNNSNV
jgi:hypothetical protein